MKTERERKKREKYNIRGKRRGDKRNRETDMGVKMKRKKKTKNK